MAIKKIIAIASAKGGVGKSTVTAALAIEKAKKLLDDNKSTFST